MIGFFSRIAFLGLTKLIEEEVGAGKEVKMRKDFAGGSEAF